MVALYLHAPAGRVGQVQMQLVDFVGSQHVDVLFQKVHGQKVTRHIEHHAAPFVGRCVLDGAAGQRSAFGSQLCQCLTGTQEAQLSIGHDNDAIARDVHFIGFRRPEMASLAKLYVRSVYGLSSCPYHLLWHGQKVLCHAGAE